MSDIQPAMVLSIRTSRSWAQVADSERLRIAPATRLHADPRVRCALEKHPPTTSASNAWAVGCTDGCPVGGTPLIERWDGTSWTQVAAPTTPYALYNLAGVAASGNSAWAVGGGGPVTLEGAATAYWNGRGWTLSHGISGAGLTGVTATSPTNAWAVGSTASGRTLILRWNGQTWRVAAGHLSPATAPASSPAPTGGAGAGGAAGPERDEPGRGHAGRQRRRGLLTWPEPGRDYLQQRRVLASGPAGQARRPA